MVDMVGVHGGELEEGGRSMQVVVNTLQQRVGGVRQGCGSRSALKSTALRKTAGSAKNECGSTAQVMGSQDI